MRVAEKLKRRRREEQEIRGYASSSLWYTGLSNAITFLQRAETGEDPLGRFGDAWGAAYNLFMMHGEAGDEEFKRFNSWVSEVKDQPATRNFFQRAATEAGLATFRSSIDKVKRILLKAQGQRDLEAWSLQTPPDKACRYFFNIIRDIRNTAYHPNFNPGASPVKKALASAADCLVSVAAEASEAMIEKPIAGTTGRATAYRFFLYPFLKNSDGFFSDYYLERLFPDMELAAFPEEESNDLLKSLAKEFETLEAGLQQADSDETLKNWCVPILFGALGAKPKAGIRIIGEDAVYEPTLILPRTDSMTALQSEYQGKDAAKDIVCLMWVLPWRTTLDAVSTDPAFESLPVTEVAHRALARSDVPWALVTNGHQLRLLSKSNAHRPRCFLECDLAAILDRRNDSQALRAFRFSLGLLSAASFTEVDESGKSRLERAALGSERHGKEIGDELKQNVYSALEELGEGFLDYLRSHPHDLDEWRHRKATNLSRDRFLASDELLEDVYHETLSLMYRLLFLFYAESRELLPLENEVYQSYSLEALRDDVHSVLDDPDPTVYFAKGSTSLWQRLSDLFKFLDKGWGNIIPAYNGGLFDPSKHEFLERLGVGDLYLARAVDLLSRTRPRASQIRGEGRKKVTYRDLDVRHLGSIYEGILEYSSHIADRDYIVMKSGSSGSVAEDYLAVAELTREQKAQLTAWQEAVEENPDNPKIPRGCKVTGRKVKGQYYLVYGGRESKRKSSGSYYTPNYIVQYIVENTLGPLVRGECRPQPERLANEAEEEMKKIGITEEHRTGPLSSDEILELKVLDPAMGSGHFLVAATEHLARAYRDACLREGKDRAFGEADAEGKFIRAKRMIAERCIYGVDQNPMAVELAKLSMWLFTMDIGRPLSFLDHHLKCGNALIGAWVKDLGQLPKFDRSGRPVLVPDTGQGNLFEQQFRKMLPVMLKDIFEIMKKETVTTEDVKDKKALDEAIEDIKRPFRNVADVWTASFFGEAAEDYVALLANQRFAAERHSGLADARRFFHWELEFPEVWFTSAGQELPRAGFSACVLNPPYIGFRLASKEDRPFWQVRYAEIFDGKGDLYYLFLGRMLELLQPLGRLGAITTRYWLESETGTSLRQVIDRRKTSQTFLDFNEFSVFENVGAKCAIALLGNEAQLMRYFVLKPEFGNAPVDTMENCLRSGDMTELFDIRTLKESREGKWQFLDGSTQAWVHILKRTCVPLSTLGATKQGIVTGCDDAFVASAPEFQRLHVEDELLHPWLKIGDLLPFLHVQRVPALKIIYANHLESLTAFPNADRFIRRHIEKLEERRECKNGLIRYFHLQWGRTKDLFEKPKLVTRKISPINCFVLDRSGYYSGADTTLFVPQELAECSLFFLLGFLNSKLSTAYYHNFGKRMDYRYEYNPTSVGQMLVPPPAQFLGPTEFADWARVKKLTDTGVDILPAALRIAWAASRLSKSKYRSPQYEAHLELLDRSVFEMLKMPDNERFFDPRLQYRWDL